MMHRLAIALVWAGILLTLIVWGALLALAATRLI